MTERWPKIRARRVTKISPWVDLIEREVEFPAGASQTYHAIGQADYLAVVALTPDEKIPLVQQYRPAIEAVTWELPAGLVDPGEMPIDSARRELLEETGYRARSIQLLGSAAACTGRLSNRIHSFFAQTGECDRLFQPEPGLHVKLFTLVELTNLIAGGEFVQQMHLGALMLAELHSFVKMPRIIPPP